MTGLNAYPLFNEENACCTTCSGFISSLTLTFESATKNKACRIEYSGDFVIDNDSAGISFKCTSPQEPETMLRVWLTDSDNDTFYSSYTVSLSDVAQSGNDYTYVFPFENFKWGYGTGNKTFDTGNGKIKIGIMNPTVNSAEFLGVRNNCVG